MSVKFSGSRTPPPLGVSLSPFVQGSTNLLPRQRMVKGGGPSVTVVFKVGRAGGKKVYIPTSDIERMNESHALHCSSGHMIESITYSIYRVVFNRR